MLAITHVPSPNMDQCVRTHVPQQPIDVARAGRQHAAYRAMLAACGAEVRVLDVHRDLPDCVFIEDTAIVLDEVAVVASMGTPSRRAEPEGIARELASYRELVHIRESATLEGGDVLRVGRTLLVGLSARTDADGIAALAELVMQFGYHVRVVAVTGCLHLKSACTALPDGSLLVNASWLDVDALAGFELVPVPADEPDAANVVLVAGNVGMAAAHPRTAGTLLERGFTVRTVDLSEFAKAEGCSTCLSLLVD